MVRGAECTLSTLSGYCSASLKILQSDAADYLLLLLLLLFLFPTGKIRACALLRLKRCTALDITLSIFKVLVQQHQRQLSNLVNMLAWKAQIGKRVTGRYRRPSLAHHERISSPSFLTAIALRHT